MILLTGFRSSTQPTCQPFLCYQRNPTKWPKIELCPVNRKWIRINIECQPKFFFICGFSLRVGVLVAKCLSNSLKNWIICKKSLTYPVIHSKIPLNTDISSKKMKNIRLLGWGGSPEGWCRYISARKGGDGSRDYRAN